MCIQRSKSRWRVGSLFEVECESLTQGDCNNETIKHSSWVLGEYLENMQIVDMKLDVRVRDMKFAIT